MRKRLVAGLPAAALGAVAAHDLVQRRHAILRNFPVIGHARFWLEAVGPELAAVHRGEQRRGVDAAGDSGVSSMDL